MTRHFALLFLGFFFGAMMAFAIAPASASIDESRISRLESDLFRLENEVSRLSSQILQLDRSIARPRPNPVEVPPVAQEQTPVSSADPMFDRLATLVIELKRRMDTIEERLVQLER
ncbi:MAG: hypothetical protein WBF52_03020 [Geitlerinemataceae cyanobacterium]